MHFTPLWKFNSFTSEWVKVAQSCPTLCDPMGYTVHGILQARILEWVAFHFSRGSSQPRDRTQVSCIAGWFFTAKSPGKPSWCHCCLVAQPCPTLFNPMDYTVHVTLQARILEWVAFHFSRGSSQPRDQTPVSCIAGRFFYQLSHKGSLFLDKVWVK